MVVSPTRLLKHSQPGCRIAALAVGILTAPFAHAASERVVYTFKGGSDGAGPSAALLKVGGTLYGTTGYGGGTGCQNNGYGTVFKLTKAGDETVLYSFQAAGTDLANPLASLTYLGGTLYGTTYYGGGSDDCSFGCGAVFSVTPAGAETVVYPFTGGRTDGAFPTTTLINLRGTLYGTTGSGGASLAGLVFSVTPAGAETVVYSFQGGSDGAHPTGLLKVDGAFYGTTYGGGAGCQDYGCGTVFKMTPAGAKTVVYTFKGGSDGAFPNGLIKLGGDFYGTTESGGGTGCQNAGGCGTVFKLTKAETETVLYSFQGDSDGGAPDAALINVGDTFYGTTVVGGPSDRGTVFSVTPAGVETVL